MLSKNELCFTENDVRGRSTSHSGPIGRVHGSHRIRDSGRAAHATLVDSTHTENVGTALHQSGDGETGKLHWCIIALDPVVGSHLTSIETQMLCGK